MAKSKEILRLLQFASPALPVGAFAYSQGLESAIESKYIQNAQQTDAWVRGVLSNNLGKLDLPYLKAINEMVLAKDFALLAKENQRLISFRETSEIRQESLQIGRAFRRLMQGLNIWNEAMPAGDIDWVTAFAYMSAVNEVEIEDSMLAYVWSWCENQVSAAIKLVPLGQTEGQKILFELADHLVSVVENAMTLNIENVSSLAFNLSVLSGEHETQYSRLFRS